MTDRKLKFPSIDAPSFHYMIAALVDAAGGRIIVGPKHVERSNRGSLTRWEEPETGLVIWARSGHEIETEAEDLV